MWAGWSCISCKCSEDWNRGPMPALAVLLESNQFLRSLKSVQWKSPPDEESSAVQIRLKSEAACREREAPDLLLASRPASRFAM